MAVQITVHFYGNKNGGFGHVALTINQIGDVTSTVFESKYISYAMCDRRDFDEEKHKIDPIDITLPPLDISFRKVMETYDQSRFWYYNAFEVEKGKPKRDSEEYRASYNILTNNCAHNVLFMLTTAGYLKGPFNQQTGTTPYQAVKAAIQAQRQFYLTNDMPLAKRIMALLENSIVRLQAKNSSKLIPSLKIKRKINMLLELQKYLANQDDESIATIYSKTIAALEDDLGGKTYLQLKEGLAFVEKELTKMNAGQNDLPTKKKDAGTPSLDSPHLSIFSKAEIDTPDDMSLMILKFKKHGTTNR